jgi:hypothetical protein
MAWYVGLAALIPLAGIAGAMMVATPVLKQQLLLALLFYLALTVTFTGGLRWGAEVVRAGREPPVARRLMAAGLPMMLAFAALLAAPLLEGDMRWQGPVVALASIAGLQLVWDGWGALRGQLPGWMGWFRLVVTSLGFGFLGLTWWAAERISDTPPPPPPGFEAIQQGVGPAPAPADPGVADLGSPDAPDTPTQAPMATPAAPRAIPVPATPPETAAPQVAPAPQAPAAQAPLGPPPLPFPSQTAPATPAQQPPP